MDEIVYQCPECNFNTDNVVDLDGHMDEFHANLLSGEDVEQSEYVHDQDEMGLEQQYTGQHGDEEEDMQNIEPYSEHEHDLDYSGYNDYEHSPDQPDLPDLQHHLQMQQHLVQHQLYQGQSHSQQQQQQSASTPNGRRQQQQKPRVSRKSAAAAVNQTGSSQQEQQPVINCDNHYERQYTCKRCGFFTNNPRAVLYHRRDFHGEKINVHECIYCQYASQYSGKVERHTLLRHKIHTNNTPKAKKLRAEVKAEDSFNHSLNMTAMAGGGGGGGGDTSPSMTNRSVTSSMAFASSAPAVAAAAEEQSSQPGSPMTIAKFQCNRCPCKYKRSNDLSKHLKMKHGEVAQRLSDYLVRIPVEAMAGNGWPKDSGSADSAEGASGHGTEDYEHEHTQNQTANDTSTLSQPKQEPSEAVAAAQTHAASSGGQQQGSYECPYCTYYSQDNDAEYLAHVKDHLSGKSFRCVLCNSVYKYRGDCVVHLKRKHQKADMYAQNYVERFSLESVDIGQVCVLLKPKQSEENENEEKLFGCAYCDYKANYKGDVFKHQTRRHPGCVKNVTALAQQQVSPADQLNAGRGPMRNSSSPYSSPYSSKAGQVFQHKPNSLSTSANNSHSRAGLANQRLQAFQYGQGPRQRTINVKVSATADQSSYSEHSQFQNDLENSNSEDHEQIYYNNSHVKDRGYRTNAADGHEDYELANGQDENEDLLYDSEYQQQVAGGEGTFDETAEYLDGDLPEGQEIDEFGNPMNVVEDDHDELVLDQELDQELDQNYLSASLPQVKRASTILASVLNGNGAALLRNRPGSSLSPLSSSSLHSSNQLQQQQQASSYLANLKFLARRRSQHALRERKFKCPLCPRTSKWQWDIRKHMRTVHRGQDTEREVVVLKEKDLVKRLQGGHGNSGGLDFDRLEQIKSKCAILNNRSLNTTVSHSQQQEPADSYDLLVGSPSGSATDPAATKKFKCAACPYRSNWKVDLFRHLRKRHDIQSPQHSHVIVLDCQLAAHTLGEYEATHDIHTQRKRTRTDPDTHQAYFSSGSEGGSSSQHQQSKRDRLDLDTSDPSSSVCLVDELDARNQLQQEENWVELQQRNNRLPVSIAELNIKPYKCLRCGFRSDRKSDTLRHIRVKHSLSNQAVKFLRIMSIKEASDSIEEYENLRLYKKIKNFKNGGSSTAANGTTNGGSGSDRDTGLDEGHSVCGSSQADTDFASAKSGHGPVHQPQQQKQCLSRDLYRCPFCSFKNHKKMVMRRHLVIHFSGAQAVRVTNPVYRCSLCTFRSKWQFFVKKHITTHHLSVKNAYVLRYPARTPSHRLDQETAHVDEQQEGRQNGDSDQNGNSDSNGHQHDHEASDLGAGEDANSGEESGPDGGSGERDAASLLEETEVTVEPGDKAAAEAERARQQHDEGQDENNRCVNDNVENDATDLVLLAEGSENSQETGSQAQLQGKQLESVRLTAYDNSTFEASYYVVGDAAKSAVALSPVSNRRKAYYCAACPYQTKTFNNVRSHLANHHYMPDHIKCRYCVYYVSHSRHLRQHELLHPEFQEQLQELEHSPLKRSASFTSNKSLVHA